MVFVPVVGRNIFPKAKDERGAIDSALRTVALNAPFTDDPPPAPDVVTTYCAAAAPVDPVLAIEKSAPRWNVFVAPALKLSVMVKVKVEPLP